MADSLNIGTTWTVNVPANSGRTVSQNLWQYSLFPMATAPSVMYPCDGLSNMNDAQLMNFDYGTTQFLDTSTNMFYQIMPMMKQWMAQQAEMYQKIMSSLHSSSSVTVTNPGTVDGTNVIKESQINSVLNKIATDPANKDRFTSKIEYVDKDGKTVKDKNLLQRLIQLSKEYQETPDTAEISEENYKLLWDIAGKYAKTGELSTSDYKILLEIAKNPGGPGAYQKPADDGDDDNGPKKAIRPAENQAAIVKGEPQNIATQFKQALYDPWGTDADKLYSASKSLNEHNIIEVFNEFGDSYGIQNDENLVDAIFDDCSGWGGGEAWLGFGSNDAKPHVDRINKALLTRATHFAQKNPEVAAAYGFLKEVKVENPEDKEQTKGLIKVSGKYYDPKQLNIPSTLIDSKDRSVTSKNIQDFVDKLSKAEKEAYGEC